MKILSLVLTFMVVLAIGCGKKTKFSDKPKNQPKEGPQKSPKEDLQKSKVAATPNPKTGTLTKKFNLSSTNTGGVIDMVWVIDNSGSMADEAQNVRDNFDRFIEKTSKFVDLKLALLSRPSHSNMGDSSSETTPGAIPGGLPGSIPRMNWDLGVTLSDKAKEAGHQQLPIGIGSYNPLGILAAAICDDSENGVISPNPGSMMGGRKKFKICGKEFGNSGESSVSNPNSTANPSNRTRYMERFDPSKVSAKLKDFFRNGAKKIFVIVSDEDSFVVNGTNFLDLIKSSIDSDPTVFAFAGMEGVNPFTASGSSSIGNATGSKKKCSAYRGEAYHVLAQKTGGKVFDICEENWTEHFDRLTENVKEIVSNQFKLAPKNEKLEIVSVKVNGNEIASDDYNFANNTITIDKKYATKDGAEVEVEYKVKT